VLQSDFNDYTARIHGISSQKSCDIFHNLWVVDGRRLTPGLPIGGGSGKIAPVLLPQSVTKPA